MRDGRRWLAGAFVAVSLLCSALAVTANGAAAADACPEPNDDLATACPLGAGSPVQSSIDRPDDVDVFRLEIAEPSRLHADLTGLPADYDLYLRNANDGVIGQSVQKGTSDEQLRTILPSGVVYLSVVPSAAALPDPTQPYTLQVSVSSSDGAELPPAPATVAEGAPASVPFGGQWVTIEILDGRVHFAARAYASAGGTEPISVVNFRFRRPDGRWDTGCHADVPTGDLYTCSMNLNRVPRGEIKFGFDIHDPQHVVTESPDGFRYLSVDR